MLRAYFEDAKQILGKIVFAVKWLADASSGLMAGTLTTAIWMAAVCMPIFVAAYVSPTLGAVSLPVAAVICYLSMLLDSRLTRNIEAKRNVSKDTRKYRRVSR